MYNRVKTREAVTGYYLLNASYFSKPVKIKGKSTLIHSAQVSNTDVVIFKTI